MKSFLKYLFFIILFLIVFLLEKSFFSNFFTFDFIFVLVFLLSFFRHGFFPLFFSVVGGLLLDFCCSLPFGVFLITLTLLSFLIQKADFFFRKNSFLSFIILFFFSFFFYQLVPFLFGIPLSGLLFRFGFSFCLSSFGFLLLK